MYAPNINFALIPKGEIHNLQSKIHYDFATDSKPNGGTRVPDRLWKSGTRVRIMDPVQTLLQNPDNPPPSASPFKTQDIHK